MQKLVIRALGALALVAVPTLAIAADEYAADVDATATDTTELGAASHALTGSGNDSGWDALTPQHLAEAKAGKANTIDLKFTPFARHEDIGDLKHDDGNVEVDRYGADLRLDYTDDYGHTWNFRYGYEYSDYDVSDTPTSAAEDALDNATVWSLSLVHVRKIDERWTGFAAVGMQYGGTDGVSFGDGSNAMAGVGGIYAFDEKLQAGLGIMGKQHFEDGWDVLPIPVLNYKIDDKNSVRVRGPRADFLHRLDDRITLRALLALESRAYRLDDDLASAASDGVVIDSHVALGGGADFVVNEWFTLRGEVGVLLAQKYRIEDKNGNRVEKYEGDGTGFFLGLQAIVAF